MDKTRLTKEEIYPSKIPNSFTNRVNETIKFIHPRGIIADCGETNLMKEILQDYFGRISSIDWDFNKECPFKNKVKYDTILCFEVLEHLYNPLLFLEQLKSMLNENGSIYLSTPYQYPQILKAIHHYHEIPPDRLMWLFEAAGLEVVRKDKITIAGNWYNHIHGIRPILRYFQKTRIYELKIKEYENNMDRYR